MAHRPDPLRSRRARIMFGLTLRPFPAVYRCDDFLRCIGVTSLRRACASRTHLLKETTGVWSVCEGGWERDFVEYVRAMRKELSAERDSVQLQKRSPVTG